MSLVHNERTKLSATWVNNLAAGAVVAGVISPMVSIAARGSPSWLPIVVSVIWLFAGVVLHLMARGILGGLRQ